MEGLKVRILKNDDIDFGSICNYCEENITLENHVQNGGTLNYINLTYYSDILLVALSNNVPIAYNSLVVTKDKTLYVYQIAVKKEYQRLGIGTELMKNAINIAQGLNMDLSAHVREYNIASKGMFESLGFKKIDSNSTLDNNYYFLKQKKFDLKR